MKMLILVMLFSMYPHQSICVANLRYFETLSYVGVTSYIKRSSDGIRDLMKHIRFKIFNRNFEATLKSGTHLMAKDFRARLVIDDGSSKYFEVDQEKMFSGHLTDRPDIKVHAHMEDDLWSIQVYEADDTYSVEPAWRLLTEKDNPIHDKLIAYRVSDFVSTGINGSKFCGVPDHAKAEMPKNFTKRWTPPFTKRNHTRGNSTGNHTRGNSTGNHTRGKRSFMDSACVLFLVGDYTFLKGKCNENYQACSALMFAFVHLADDIFKSTVFGESSYNEISGIGLEIGELVLFSSFTQPVSGLGQRHFNENIDWTIHAKLDAFSIYASYMTEDRSYCANHLFADYPFPDRILGLAWLSTICYSSIPGYMKRNSGVSSGTDNIEGPISTLQMNLVFAHELGHNFGSEHDAAGGECSMSENEGGNFLMWPRSVSGKFPNHHKFSPCSARSIGKVLEYSHCLTPRSVIIPFCGNGVLDRNEECDAGAYGVINTDPCCTNECKLRSSSICSQMNQACCLNCTISPARTPCQSVEPEQCKKESFCNGISFSCPDPDSMDDWTKCRDRGQCYRGMCRSFCSIKSIIEGRNLRGCLCQDNEYEACKWCCYDNSQPNNPGPCKVYSNESLSDGRKCYKGFCKNGNCVTETVSVILRIYNYLPTMSAIEFGKLIKANVVMFIVFLSLLVWLPPVYFINEADKRQRMERELLMNDSRRRFQSSCDFQMEEEVEVMMHPSDENFITLLRTPSYVFNKGSEVDGKHSEAHDKRSEIRDKHNDVYDKHSDVYDKRSEIREKHIAFKNRRSEVYDRISEVRDGHSETYDKYSEFSSRTTL